MRLTDLSVRAVKAPARGATIYADDMLPGFGVRVSQAGTKSYVLTHGVRRQRETIGRVGILSLQEARREAKRRLAEHALGRARPRSIRWNAAVEEFLDDVRQRRRKESTCLEYARVLKRDFRYGDTVLSEIRPADVDANLRKLMGSARFHAFTTARAFFNWAYRRHYVEVSPMSRMQPPPGSKPRTRILTDNELAVVWLAAGDSEFGHIVKLLILTGQRVGEITNLTAAMIGKDTITLPASLAKNGREHTLPIGPLAASMARPLSYKGLSKAKARLDEASGVFDWTLHDLRRTFATGLAALGVSLPAIERYLNHVSGSFGGIVGVYQRYDFMREMRAAAVKWEEHLVKIAAPVKLAAA